MLRMQSRSNGHAEGPLRILRIGEDQRVALILMRDLVERAKQPDPRLDCEDIAAEGDRLICYFVGRHRQGCYTARCQL